MEHERTWAEINLDNIGHNLGLVRAKIDSVTQIMAVVKANAYGHGAVEVAKYLVGKADCFGVALLEEGRELRRAGIKEPILILGGVSPSLYREMVELDITPTVFSLEDAVKLSNTARDIGKKIKIHIAVDTGMSRVGFLPEEWGEVIKISDLRCIEIEGIFTHYACADEKDKTRSLNQLDKFISFYNKLEENGLTIPYKHISNSAGIIEFDSSHFNIVRMGIMLYGLYPSGEVNKDFGLKPAMSLKTRIIHTKTLPPGCGVSYGATYVTDKITHIATLPIGYADGYPRAMSSCGKVIIRGEYASVIGRVCMDQIMVDVTDIPGVASGDIAVVVGEERGNKITAEDIGCRSMSFNYEFVCGIGMRVPRIYIKDGKIYNKVDYLG